MPSWTRFIDTRLAQLPGGVNLQWPGGQAGAPGSSVLLRLRNRQLLKYLASGRIGTLADAYVRGDLDIEGSLSDVMAVAGALAGNPVARGRPLPWVHWLNHLRSRWQHHSPARDRRQVQAHYDVSDAFYSLWLDPLRVYSCAYFADPGVSLARAQEAKLDLACRKLQLGRGMRFLDIGAGWGGLLMWAAQHYGVRGLGITASRNQHAHVQSLIDAAGLNGQVQVQLLDYRELQGSAEFDRIASVGMFEHVGSAQAQTYFDVLNRLLRPGGLLLNHAIAAGGVDNDQLGAGMGDFISRNIFPGGELLHVSHTAEALARAGLELLDAENLRPHYARTLWAWSDSLERQLDAARALTNEATVRAYRLYLAGSAMCFERGWLALYQLLATKPELHTEGRQQWAAGSDYPYTRKHMLG
ncbi:MAG: class I SAM-dependent methyltransferase [Pseudomonadota bacterium]|nr:class I SAM-dependent methyltransferase [Pseudomonadota bacterium]